jgi:hypothetical protein
MQFPSYRHFFFWDIWDIWDTGNKGKGLRYSFARFRGI